MNISNRLLCSSKVAKDFSESWKYEQTMVESPKLVLHRYCFITLYAISFSKEAWLFLTISNNPGWATFLMGTSRQRFNIHECARSSCLGWKSKERRDLRCAAAPPLELHVEWWITVFGNMTDHWLYHTKKESEVWNRMFQPDDFVLCCNTSKAPNPLKNKHEKTSGQLSKMCFLLNHIWKRGKLVNADLSLSCLIAAATCQIVVLVQQICHMNVTQTNVWREKELEHNIPSWRKSL